jgi:hypothetical protein
MSKSLAAKNFRCASGSPNIKCAQGGRTTLIELTDAGQSAFGRIGRGRKIAALAGTQTAR